MPFTMLFNENNEIICCYAGYCSGFEEQLCEKILHIPEMQTPALATIK
jgi:hypothetical protein